MPSVDGLHHQEVREALRLLGGDVPAHRGGALRQLRELLAAPGAVRSALDHAPDSAPAAFARLAQDGPAPVEDLLGRGWWGHGTLPPPLDWLQRRGLVVVGEDGLVHATAEACEGFAWLTLDLPEASPAPNAPDPSPLRVEEARSVVVGPTSAALDRALAVLPAGLRAIAPTVAVSSRSPAVVAAALRGAGMAIAEDLVVPTQPGEPALPTVTEEAVGPRPVRALLERALAEGRQVRLEYFASSRGGAATDRVVDPWTFRDDLLRGYCHLRSSERTFAVDRIGHAQLLPSPIAHPES
ncbi:MAG: WYL domain-containing protein [Egibacteraceae bacterium]